MPPNFFTKLFGGCVIISAITRIVATALDEPHCWTQQTSIASKQDFVRPIYAAQAR
jgi:hypothetical protein